MGESQRWRSLYESKGENRMIKQIVKALKASTIITDWMISEVQTLSSQAQTHVYRLFKFSN